MSDTADDHVRISRERLLRRKRDDESFDEVIGRLLDDDRDLLAGFGAAADRSGETLAETVARRTERSGGRIDELAEDGTDDT